MNEIQEIQMKLIRLSSFNAFNGDKVADDLVANKKLWKGAVITRIRDLIFLRDIKDNCWNVDTLYILPEKGFEEELKDLAGNWDADEIDWIGGEEASRLLGEWSPKMENNPNIILSVWWD